MLLIPCPWCGEREETEFVYGGEAHVARPKNPDALSDAEWADYLFMRKNPKGMHRERWFHAHGCRRWFNVERDTVSHAIVGGYKVSERPPGETPPPKTPARSRRRPAAPPDSKAGPETET